MKTRNAILVLVIFAALVAGGHYWSLKNKIGTSNSTWKSYINSPEDSWKKHIDSLSTEEENAEGMQMANDLFLEGKTYTDAQYKFYKEYSDYMDADKFTKMQKSIDSAVTDTTWQTYTDAKNRFSFDYPASWIPVQSGETINFNNIGQVGEDSLDITFKEGNTITDSDAHWGTVTYSFDTKSKKWVVEGDFMGPPGQPVGSGVPKSYTDSGLPILEGTGRWGTDIVALSTKTFLVIHHGGGGGDFIIATLMDHLAKTVKNVK